MNELSIIDNALLKDEPYPVDFDDAWQWVGYNQKGDALEMLKRNFQDGEDFSGKRLKSTGGRPREVYFLTSDCFKEFCMMAGTDKGKEADLTLNEVSSNGVTQARAVNIINESGLYSLVLSSRKPEAKAFKKWITSEVLP